MNKRAIITDINGQDGSYLYELLVGLGYEVHSLKRRSSRPNFQENDLTYQETDGLPFDLHYGDLSEISQVIKHIAPHEIYDLGMHSNIRVSFDDPIYTAQSITLGSMRILEAVRLLDMTDSVRIFQASTNELFGIAQESPQTETTPFYPRSPYAIAKLAAYWITVNYRESYGMYASTGILFNHESARRSEMYVTRKITKAVARIANGLQDKLYLGDLGGRRDWGHARDFVRAMHLSLQQDHPGDYVIATGEQHSVREFASKAFEQAGIPIVWKGSNADEKGINGETGKALVEIDPDCFRFAEVHSTLGNSEKAKRQLGWKPAISFDELIGEMVASDLELARKEATASQEPKLAARGDLKGY